jgi:hypothetical protein
MSTYQDLQFHLGEDWSIDFECKDSSGTVINITAATIQWRLSTVSGTTVMTRSVSDGITITSGSLGTCSLRVTPSHQTTGSVAASTRYYWELKVTTSGGVASVQARGSLEVLPSLLAS